MLDRDKQDASHTHTLHSIIREVPPGLCWWASATRGLRLARLRYVFHISVPGSSSLPVDNLTILSHVWVSCPIQWRLAPASFIVPGRTREVEAPGAARTPTCERLLAHCWQFPRARAWACMPTCACPPRDARAHVCPRRHERAGLRANSRMLVPVFG